MDLRNHSPACRGSSLKCAFAVGVLHDMRRQDFNVDAARICRGSMLIVACSRARRSTTARTTSGE